jgi:iron complex outermembrane receptor protein
VSSRRALVAGLLSVTAWQREVVADEPVTITVQGDARPQGEIPAEPYLSTSRVRRERLTAPALKASDVLRSEAGVQISESGGLGAPATAAIRGATAAQTPVYLGMVRLNDLVGGVADLSTLPLWLVDHVDVYRGNAPFEADELGIAGAIVLEPRRPRRSEAAAGATVGSFGTRGGFGYVALADGDDGVLAGLSAERAENDYEFEDDRGTLFQAGDDQRQRRKNADSRLLDGWLLARLRPSRRARLELLLNSVTREQGAPKLALVPSEQARSTLRRTLGALTARLGLSEAYDSVLTLRTSALDARSELTDPARELGTLSERTRIDGRRVEQQALWQLALSSRFRLGLGATASSETLTRLDDEAQSSARANSLLGAARLEWRGASGLSVFGLLAAPCRSTAPGAGGGCRDLSPTGRVGVGVSRDGYTTYLTVSRYQRQPALGELYGAGVLVRGNALLRPELGVGADLGGRAQGRLGPLQAHVASSLFARQATDLVAYARTAQGYVVPLNVSQARVLGAELSTGATALGHVSLDCNVTLLDPRDTTEARRLRNEYLPFTSRLVVAPRLLVTTGELAGRQLSRAELGLAATYLSNRFADAAGLIVIPEQLTLDVSGAASWWSGVLVTRARLGNLLGTERFDVVGYPLPGRSLYVSAEVHTP